MPKYGGVDYAHQFAQNGGLGLVVWSWGQAFFFGVGLSNFDSKTDSSFICL